ncbi:hypothetical protein Dimus_028935 [Dionaea muscipula]
MDMDMNMASVVSAVLPLLALLAVSRPPLAARSDFLSPLLSPLFDSVCKEVECGKGNCKPSVNSSFPFGCECDDGWNQPLSLNFLPCVIPNCTIASSCLATAPSPSQLQQHHTNGSIFDPCSWGNICGSGKCNKTSPFTYSCVCSEGSSNLLNTTIFPCFGQCELGGGCSNLGISLFNKSTASPPPPPLPDNGKSQASSPTDRRFHPMMMMMMIAVPITLVFLGFGI